MTIENSLKFFKFTAVPDKETLKKKYRLCSRMYHPDMYKGKDAADVQKAHDIFLTVQKAYAVLQQAIDNGMEGKTLDSMIVKPTTKPNTKPVTNQNRAVSNPQGRAKQLKKTVVPPEFARDRWQGKRGFLHYGLFNTYYDMDYKP